MRLWTFQGVGFSLVDGPKPDPSKAHYKDDPKIVAAYQELAPFLGFTDYRFIWCYVRRQDRDGHRITDKEVEWTLDVPDERVLCVTDTFIWNRIIGHGAYPEFLRNQWYDEALAMGESGCDHCKRREAEYHAQPEPPGGWWS